MLYRSRTEIGRIMQMLAEGGCAVSSKLGNNHQFVSHLLAVNLTTGHFFIAYSENKLLNSTLFARPVVEFTTSYQTAHFAFQAANPSASLHEGQPA
ncbi:MAG TPA: flagellar regulator YcgR PilZN domain-containing protein, partial [Gallionella sp.]|nr:flagellar regulator YcgR PilZN domain-containing protein [Gallionella sp.]